MSKGHLIRRLKRLTPQPAFARFMELPAELRLRVYSYLLIGPHLYPDILYVSQKVYSEASPVLYDENEFKISYMWLPLPPIRQGTLMVGQIRLDVSLAMAGKQVIHSTGKCLLAVLTDDIVAGFRRARNVLVDLDIRSISSTYGREIFGSETKALCDCFLMLSGRRCGTGGKLLTVHFRAVSLSPLAWQPSGAELDHMPYPRAMLGDETELRVVGAPAQWNTTESIADIADFRDLGIYGETIANAARILCTPPKGTYSSDLCYSLGTREALSRLAKLDWTKDDAGTEVGRKLTALRYEVNRARRRLGIKDKKS